MRKIKSFPWMGGKSEKEEEENVHNLVGFEAEKPVEKAEGK